MQKILVFFIVFLLLALEDRIRTRDAQKQADPDPQHFGKVPRKVVLWAPENSSLAF
jgi:hypothetical protein